MPGIEAASNLGLPLPSNVRDQLPDPDRRPAASWPASLSRSPGGRRCGRPACSISKATRRATSTRRRPIRRSRQRSPRSHRSFTPASKSGRPIACSKIGLRTQKKIYSAAKDAASYWVGLLLFDEGKFASAEDWFSDPRLARRPAGTWADGTRYNLARTSKPKARSPKRSSSTKPTLRPNATATASAHEAAQKTSHAARLRRPGPANRCRTTVDVMLAQSSRSLVLVALVALLVAGMGWPRAMRPLVGWMNGDWVVAFVTFIMALPLETSAIWGTVRRPGAAWLGAFMNAAVCPPLGWLASRVLPPELAIGVIVATTVPCTLATAAVWTRRAGGNDAVAFLVTMITNLACFLVVPGWLWLLSDIRAERRLQGHRARADLADRAPDRRSRKFSGNGGRSAVGHAPQESAQLARPDRRPHDGADRRRQLRRNARDDGATIDFHGAKCRC